MLPERFTFPNEQREVEQETGNCRADLIESVVVGCNNVKVKLLNLSTIDSDDDQEAVNEVQQPFINERNFNRDG